MKLEFFIFTFLIYFFQLVKTDIPVHCLKSQVIYIITHQIVGRWKFFLTVPAKKTVPEQYQLTCGHSNPSHESSAYKFNMNQNDFISTIEMELKDSDEALLNDNNEQISGKWTMVYDEGFDIIFNKNNSIKNDRSYFVFSKYGMNNEGSKSIKSKWVSYCYSTLIGWYHIGNKWGCMYGYKLGVNKDEVTNGEAENKLNVVQGEITRRNKDDEGLYTQQKYYMDESSSNGEKVEADSFEAGSTQSSYIKVSESGKNNLKKESAFLETKFESEFTEKNEMLLTSTTTFTYNAMLVEAINSENLLFKAENYEEFSKMSFKELNKFAGRIKRLRNKKTSHKKRNGFSSKKISELGSFIQKKSNKLKISKDKENLMAINDIPENFSWAEKMSSPRSQGSCGSCYAVSTLSMLEARLRKNYGDIINNYFPNQTDFSISLDHVMKCSYYNQGCEGGYSYLVSKFFNEFEMILDQCFDKSNGVCSKTLCKNPNFEKLNFKVANYRYVGGSYGRCSEQIIMREVYKNGPIVISLEPDYSFMLYRSGIYKSPNNNWFVNNFPRPEWEKVDHSLVLVGWGVEVINEKKVKYWILQNSWGSNWGENGYLRFIRGIDHLGIESICEAADPIVTVEN